MRYLAICFFLIGCNVPDESFEETPVCFEDGAVVKHSERSAVAEDLLQGKHSATMLAASGEDAYGPTETPHPKGNVNIPCAKYEIPDEYVEGCFTVVCEGNCSMAEYIKFPPCGLSYCLPRDDGWQDPGYPIPFAD